MRLPRMGFTPIGIMALVAIVALGMTTGWEQKRRRELEASIVIQGSFLHILKKQVDEAERHPTLRAIFGDLGLVILREPDRVEVLRLGEARAHTEGTPEVLGIERTLEREFAERLGEVLLRKADFQMYTDLPYPWSRGFRIWRRGEHLDVFYERMSEASHLDVQTVAKNWRGVVVDDSGWWHCVSHESLSALIDTIEGGMP